MHSAYYSILLVNEKGTELRDGFPWASLGSGKVVDIGGGSGHISNELARVSFSCHLFIAICMMYNSDSNRHFRRYDSLYRTIPQSSSLMIRRLSMDV